jgi:hypothetical protein
LTFVGLSLSVAAWCTEWHLLRTQRLSVVPLGSGAKDTGQLLWGFLIPLSNTLYFCVFKKAFGLIAPMPYFYVSQPCRRCWDGWWLYHSWAIAGGSVMPAAGSSRCGLSSNLFCTILFWLIWTAHIAV